VWLRAGVTHKEIVVAPLAPSESAAPLHIAVAEGGSTTAVDGEGTRWARVGRVALPAWAAAGARVTGSGDVAVRAIVRAPRDVEDEEPASAPKAEAAHEDPEVLDDAQLVKMARAILSAPRGSRGAAYFRRAMLLAKGGAGTGAMEDARAARAAGAKAPDGLDPIAFVRAAIRHHRPHVDPMPPDVHAYGVEPDFDPGARRCT